MDTKITRYLRCEGRRQRIAQNGHGYKAGTEDALVYGFDPSTHVPTRAWPDSEPGRPGREEGASVQAGAVGGCSGAGQGFSGLARDFLVRPRSSSYWWW